MKAVIYEKYGPPEVLQLKEVEKPTPEDNEVLIKVYATSVNYMDWGFLRGDPFMVRLWSGFIKPRNKILGGDVAGYIEAIGKNVTKFQTGDEVFGESGLGAFCEYVCTSEDAALAIKPGNITFEEAAAVPVAGITALQGLLYKGEIKSGHKVLINGASGGVGTFAVQIAKSFGAEVTAVCSTNKLDMVKSIGADYAVDYTREDFTQNGKQYDLIIAANGYHPISVYKRSLNNNGRYVCTGGSGTQIAQSIFLGPWLSRFGKKILCNMGVAKANKNDLSFLGNLLQSGKIKPYIDRRYSLSETAEAIRYIGEGHAKGKIIITTQHDK